MDKTSSLLLYWDHNYMHVHTCTRPQSHKCTHAYTQIYTFTHIQHIHTHSHLYINTHQHIFALIHAHTHIHVHIYQGTQGHTHIFQVPPHMLRAQADIHTLQDAHTHTETQQTHSGAPRGDGQDGGGRTRSGHLPSSLPSAALTSWVPSAQTAAALCWFLEPVSL